MLKIMCKSKIHRATVLQADLNYVGSITIDEELMRSADIQEYEQVHVLNINNGNRFITYAIKGEKGSGTVCVNGAASRLVHVGDLVIILSYAQYQENELNNFKPKIVHVDCENKIIKKQFSECDRHPVS